MSAPDPTPGAAFCSVVNIIEDGLQLDWAFFGFILGLGAEPDNHATVHLARQHGPVDLDQLHVAAVGPHLKLLADNGARVMVYGEVADSIQGAPIPLGYLTPAKLTNIIDVTRSRPPFTTTFTNGILSTQFLINVLEEDGAMITDPDRLAEIEYALRSALRRPAATPLAASSMLSPAIRATRPASMALSVMPTTTHFH